jgi:glycosyltransferase involved in cell wall biosynthesis
MTNIDVLVAVRDEEDSIPVFLERIAALPLPADVALKVVFIEDSSTDGTRPLLRRLAATDPSVGYYSLARGFGQGIALTFGMSRSRADAMIMMDVDGSHPPEAIPELVDGFLDGAQAVQCVRRTLANRRLHRRLGASSFQALARLVVGVDFREQNIFFRLISADVARRILEQPRYWRYLRFPLPRQPEGALRFVPVDTLERAHGDSKYGFLRLVNLALDGMLSVLSTKRFMVLGLLAMLFGALLVVLGFAPIAVLLALLALWPLRRFLVLRRRDTLERIEVAECANVPETAGNP